MKIGKSLSYIGRGIASATLAVLAACSPQQQIPEATLISTKGQVINSEVDNSEVEKGTDQNIEELQIKKQLPRREFRLYAANPKDAAIWPLKPLSSLELESIHTCSQRRNGPSAEG